jgi:hypothetical protein
MPGFRGALVRPTDLILFRNCIATEPARWRHSCGVRVAVQPGLKGLPDLPKLDLFAVGKELHSCGDRVYVLSPADKDKVLYVSPRDGERNVHGNASFEPAFFERALSEAAAAGAGLALLHSHPLGEGWQGMSPDDVKAKRGNAGARFGSDTLAHCGNDARRRRCLEWPLLDQNRAPDLCPAQFRNGPHRGRSSHRALHG